MSYAGVLPSNQGAKDSQSPLVIAVTFGKKFLYVRTIFLHGAKQPVTLLLTLKPWRSALKCGESVASAVAGVGSAERGSGKDLPAEGARSARSQYNRG